MPGVDFQSDFVGARRGGGWAPVFSPRELVDSKQLTGRDYWVRVVHEDIGESFIYPGAPFKFSETPWEIGGPAPLLGQHNAQVFGDWLGMSAGDVDALRNEGVI